MKKTNIKTTPDWDSFEIDGEEMELVTSFTFTFRTTKEKMDG